MQGSSVARQMTLSEILQDVGVPRKSLRSYQHEISVCSHTGDLDRAERLLNEMYEGGFTPTEFEFNGLIHACTRVGDKQRAEHYFEMMRLRGIVPDVVSYNSIINACAVSGDEEGAQQWLAQMAQNGARPNVVTYGTLCKLLARRGQVEKIENLMESVVADGHSLNEYHFASLISACSFTNPPDQKKAEQAFFNMAERGLRTTSVRRCLAKVVGHQRALLLVRRAARKYPVFRHSSSTSLSTAMPGSEAMAAPHRDPEGRACTESETFDPRMEDHEGLARDSYPWPTSPEGSGLRVQL
mmetsp:Transcript_20517/g.44795  ORF Transcript_20517/g.44795 Transcript_20517/m.44795 type:complete len:298 (-) Transcript_20517:418-1311(-)|eukprot:CAMPEP_0170583706 /NCGR_PEP_ID=MMETSP0224-20130122/8283_1 /TAXON_ID=285029 /ORGANISM="Togula jolla, Strain CCCM 725" /LENGTH=297 /DNA_ID=CAMNT_0010907061 /DNA_START=156 /DNA_END=1049 /DNA_ORIENTATION=+